MRVVERDEQWERRVRVAKGAKEKRGEGGGGEVKEVRTKSGVRDKVER